MKVYTRNIAPDECLRVYPCQGELCFNKSTEGFQDKKGIRVCGRHSLLVREMGGRNFPCPFQSSDSTSLRRQPQKPRLELRCPTFLPSILSKESPIRKVSLWGGKVFLLLRKAVFFTISLNQGHDFSHVSNPFSGEQGVRSLLLNASSFIC